MNPFHARNTYLPSPQSHALDLNSPLFQIAPFIFQISRQQFIQIILAQKANYNIKKLQNEDDNRDADVNMIWFDTVLRIHRVYGHGEGEDGCIEAPKAG
jgi:hypothetical protein